jgi:hypothetical protein
MSKQPIPQQPQQQPAQQVQVELPANLDAAYSNFVVIQHSPSEFILDFARIMPNVPNAKVGARVVMTPMHAKLLLRALAENIEKYEAQFGDIYMPQQGEALANQLFKG